MGNLEQGRYQGGFIVPYESRLPSSLGKAFSVIHHSWTSAYIPQDEEERSVMPAWSGLDVSQEEQGGDGRWEDDGEDGGDEDQADILGDRGWYRGDHRRWNVGGDEGEDGEGM